MTWRTVVISQRAKLDLKMNCLVVRGTETARVFLDEIGTIIVESTAVSLTAALISECINRKIKLIFCDLKHNPCCELVAYYGAYNTSYKIQLQKEWTEEIKADMWALIIREKIINQREVLKKFGLPGVELLNNYLMDIEPGDKTNREGHAAKVYFHNLYGEEFSRDSNEGFINSALNYGYAILLSAFNREIVSCGYLTQFGLFHRNMFNYFNLGSDLMEPFRPVVDLVVKEMDLTKFEKDEKHKIVEILEREVFINNRKYHLTDAITIYVKSVFACLESGELSQFRCIRNEL